MCRLPTSPVRAPNLQHSALKVHCPCAPPCRRRRGGGSPQRLPRKFRNHAGQPRAAGDRRVRRRAAGAWLGRVLQPVVAAPACEASPRQRPEHLVSATQLLCPPCIAPTSFKHSPPSSLGRLAHAEHLPIAPRPPTKHPQIIPKTLAVNAAKDATDLVARLRAFHYTAQSKPGSEALARVRAAEAWEEGGRGLGSMPVRPAAQSARVSPPRASRLQAACSFVQSLFKHTLCSLCSCCPPAAAAEWPGFGARRDSGQHRGGGGGAGAVKDEDCAGAQHGAAGGAAGGGGGGGGAAACVGSSGSDGGGSHCGGCSGWPGPRLRPRKAAPPDVLLTCPLNPGTLLTVVRAVCHGGGHHHPAHRRPHTPGARGAGGGGALSTGASGAWTRCSPRCLARCTVWCRSVHTHVKLTLQRCSLVCPEPEKQEGGRSADGAALGARSSRRTALPRFVSLSCCLSQP